MKTKWPDSSAFWNNKTVCVTGGAGFLGSYLVEKSAFKPGRPLKTA